MSYLLVISKVVPKIWARTNSAILENLEDTARGFGRVMAISGGHRWICLPRPPTNPWELQAQDGSGRGCKIGGGVNWRRRWPVWRYGDCDEVELTLPEQLIYVGLVWWRARFHA